MDHANLSAQPCRRATGKIYIGASAAAPAACSSHHSVFQTARFRHSGMRRRDKIAKLFCAEGAGPESMAPQHLADNARRVRVSGWNAETRTGKKHC
jgi:hypothetical protein